MMYTRIIIASIVVALQFTPGYPATGTPCATPGMVLSSDKQYCFGIGGLTREWNYHTVICDAYAATLVSIDSEDKNTAVKTFLNAQSLSSSDKVYIGLTNIIGAVDNWLWYGGNITTFDNWGTSEPDNSYRYNCAYISGADDYKWHADGCLKSYLGVCERAATTADGADK